MMTQREGQQLKLHCLTIEDLVPQGHFLRKLDALVDFSFIYDEVRELYCADNGRPGTDPVMLVKYLLVGYLYGIESERRIEQEIEVNVAYRWFLGMDLDERVPDHSTISQNRRRRFNGEDLFRHLFERILRLCMALGLVEGRIILTDSTHVKANASRRSEVVVLAEEETREYLQRLDQYEIQERTRLMEAGKLPVTEPQTTGPAPAMVPRRVSTSDPQAGFLKRGQKPQGMHYLSHQSVDTAHGIVVDVAATPGHVSDASPYIGRIEYIQDNIGLPIEEVGVDSGYDISIVHQALADKGIAVNTPPTKKADTYKVKFDKSVFRYDGAADAFICPADKRLHFAKLERTKGNICRRYEAQREDCKCCPHYDLCVNKTHSKRCLRVNIFEEAMRRNHENDGSAHHTHILKLRQIWCEGSFAAQKRRHNLKALLRCGIEAANDHCLLAATALNLKRMVKCLG